MVMEGLVRSGMAQAHIKCVALILDGINIATSDGIVDVGSA